MLQTSTVWHIMLCHSLTLIRKTPIFITYHKEIIVNYVENKTFKYLELKGRTLTATRTLEKNQGNVSNLKKKIPFLRVLSDPFNAEKIFKGQGKTS